MRHIIFTIIFSIATVTCYCQEFYTKDTAIKYISEPVKISYSPTGLVSSIRVAAVKFKSGEQGIQFSVTTKQMVDLRIRDIVLKTSGGGSFPLLQGYRDSAMTTANGGLFLSAIYFLDKSAQDFIKQEIIDAFAIPLGRTYGTFVITKKSGKKLQELANSNY